MPTMRAIRLLRCINMPPKKLSSDPRTEATRVAIIEAAESLFAEGGIDGVSLRQIGSAAGSSNPGVVAYHFGDKAGLMDAIFHYRLPALDQRRGELLAVAESDAQEHSLFRLLEALWLPLFEQVDIDGYHSYARFIGALIRSNWGARRMQMNDSYPQTIRLSQAIKAAMPSDCQSLFESRMNMSAIMITGVLQLVDQLAGNSRQSKKSRTLLFNDALSMAAAAFAAPCLQSQ